MRAGELAEQLEAWTNEKGKESMGLLTLTVRHARWHGLEDLRSKLMRANRDLWNRLRREMRPRTLVQRGWLPTEHQAAKWEAAKVSMVDVWDLEGTVRALEVTHGQNGWHPHLHQLLFFRAPADDEKRAWVRRVVTEVWLDVVDAVFGKEHAPSWERGVDLRGGDDAARYVLKLALEMADPLTKTGRKLQGKPFGSQKGRSPWQLLSDAIDGDDDSGELFVAYRRAMKGARVFEYSRAGGFKAKLRRMAGQTEEEKTDEELMAEGENARPVLEVERSTWRNLVRTPGARCELLRIVESNGADAAQHWLIQERFWQRPAVSIETANVWFQRLADAPYDFPGQGPPTMTQHH